MSFRKNEKPLQLADTLHDLAILRASDIDLLNLLPKIPRQSSAEAEADEYVDKSYEFIREARAAIRIADSDKVDIQGAKIDSIRSEMESIAGQIEDVTKKSLGSSSN